MIMKKSILLLTIMMTCAVASAQVGMVRSTGGSVDRVKKEIVLKKYPAEKGLQQEFQFSYMWVDRYIPKYSSRNGAGHDPANSMGMIDYIIGKRINNWVFVGAGVGVHLYEQEEADPYSKLEQSLGNGRFVDYNLKYDVYKSLGVSADIPIYVHSKVYFTDTRVKPFFTTYVGMRFGINAKQQVMDLGAYFSAGLGFSAYLTEKLDLTFSVEYQLCQERFEGVTSWWECYYDRCCTWRDCKYYGTGTSHCHYEISTGPCTNVSHGFAVHLGLAF